MCKSLIFASHIIRTGVAAVATRPKVSLPTLTKRSPVTPFQDTDDMRRADPVGPSHQIGREKKIPMGPTTRKGHTRRLMKNYLLVRRRQLH